jgi:hypothetical protein
MINNNPFINLVCAESRTSDPYYGRPMGRHHIASVAAIHEVAKSLNLKSDVLHDRELKERVVATIHIGDIVYYGDEFGYSKQPPFDAITKQELAEITSADYARGVIFELAHQLDSMRMSDGYHIEELEQYYEDLVTWQVQSIIERPETVTYLF